MASSSLSENQQLCLFFSKGFCKRGSECRFIHAKGKPKYINEMCRYFKEGSCLEGAGCPYLHTKPNQISNPSNIDNAQQYSRQQQPRYESTREVQHVSEQNMKSKLSTSALTAENDDDDGAYFFGMGPTPKESQNIVRTDHSSVSSTSSVLKWSQVAAHPDISDAAAATNTAPFVTKPLTETNTSINCKYFAQGNCRLGDSCKFSHKTIRPQAQYYSSEAHECGICFSDIIGEFGLLDCCSHSFCLMCIRGWREKGMEQGAADSVRRCPICRRNSNVITPSSVFPLNEDDKQRIMEDYRAALGRIPCKHFRAKGECPFGTSCFYAHLLADGITPAPVQAPRLVMNEEGRTCAPPPARLSDFI